MLYIVIGGKKIYIPEEIVKRYGLKAGEQAPFTGYKILEDVQQKGQRKKS